MTNADASGTGAGTYYVNGSTELATETPLTLKRLEAVSCFTRCSVMHVVMYGRANSMCNPYSILCWELTEKDTYQDVLSLGDCVSRPAGKRKIFRSSKNETLS